MNHTDRPFRDEPTEVLQAALDLVSRHAQQAARFRPTQEGDALPSVADLFQAELQQRGGQTLPPPQGPEYTPCVSCGHIQPDHRPDAGACLKCGCGAYRVESRTANCRTCGALIGWVDCPTGGWWAHEQHPADDHDAEPAASAVVSPPTSRAELRDRIAALFRHPPGVERLGDATPGEIADAVLAELGESTSRAAVLLDAAVTYEEILKNAPDHSKDPRYWTAVRDVVMGLRRLAAETQQQPDTEAQAARCPSCDHERKYHDVDGRCWFTVDHGVPDSNLVCPCAPRRDPDEEQQPAPSDGVTP